MVMRVQSGVTSVAHQRGQRFKVVRELNVLVCEMRRGRRVDKGNINAVGGTGGGRCPYNWACVVLTVGPGFDRRMACGAAAIVRRQSEVVMVTIRGVGRRMCSG